MHCTLCGLCVYTCAHMHVSVGGEQCVSVGGERRVRVEL